MNFSIISFLDFWQHTYSFEIWLINYIVKTCFSHFMFHFFSFHDK